MNQPHIIRIRGPWQRSIVEDATDTTDLSRTVTMPTSWVEDLGAEFRGLVEYRRFFNKPTGIAETTSIALTFTHIVGHAVVKLNDEVLGRVDWPISTAKFDVAGKLHGRNDLKVKIGNLTAADQAILETANRESPEGGLVGEVRLEIG